MHVSSRVARAFTRNPVAMLGLCLLGSMAFVEVSGRRDCWILGGRQPCGDANS